VFFVILEYSVKNWDRLFKANIYFEPPRGGFVLENKKEK